MMKSFCALGEDLAIMYASGYPTRKHIKVAKKVYYVTVWKIFYQKKLYTERKVLTQKLIIQVI